MGRTFEFGINGLQQILTGDGNILSTATSASEVSVVEGNISTIVHNPNAIQPDLNNRPMFDLPSPGLS
ncbi:MAG: hypothetical protein GC137_03985 [Alphaproteobacteria bacterium]|nr:hypothetical protein [Alphaproteobacteria bacterium]